jgi:ribosome biogenesis GTPase / thiamine phosphate phosphatase
MAKRVHPREEDVRIRPARSTRPRTKDRPDYSDAVQAYAIAVDRGRITCLVNDALVVTAMRARELGKKSVVVGDHVGLVGDTSGAEGTLARIVTVNPRRNALTRTVDDSAELERMIVSNVDQMAIVIAAANPEPREGLVDRALVVAFDQGIAPVIILTKTDLLEEKSAREKITAFLAGYRAIDIPVIETKRGADISAIRDLLAGKVTVLLGHSGVGKSTLVNALVESADRVTGIVNEVTGRGRHTSSSAVALALDSADGRAGGWIIDTPGVRSFGVSHVDENRVLGAFSEFREYLDRCPKNCSHDEAGCALNELGGTSNRGTEIRLDSLRRILKGSKSD